MHLSARLGLAFLAFSTAAFAENVGVVRETSLAPVLTAPLSALDFTSQTAPVSIDLRQHFTIPGVTGETVQFNTSLGIINAELLSQDAPLTVTNFKAYLATDTTSVANKKKTYDNTFIHRAAENRDILGNLISEFIIQGGGYTLATDYPHIPTLPPVVNEFKVANTRGTIAMAKIGNQPNSATSEWFINLSDNRQILDNQNGGFTVFSRVLGKGMDVADAIAKLYYYQDYYPSASAFSKPKPNPADGYVYYFDELPLSLSNNQLYFVAINSVRALPLQPPVTGKGASVLNYSITANSAPAVAAATITNGVLKIVRGKSFGKAVLTIRAAEAGGAFVESNVEVTRSGLPTVLAQLPATTLKPFGLAATLTAQNSMWPAGTIQWQRKPAGSSSWSDIAENDPLITGGTSATINLPLHDAAIPAAVLAALQGSQFRFVLTNSVGVVTSKATTLKITTLPIGFSTQPPKLVTGVLGSSVTISVTTLPAATNTSVTYKWERRLAGSPANSWVPVVSSTEQASTRYTLTTATVSTAAATGTTAATVTTSARLTISFTGADDAALQQAIALNDDQYRCTVSNALGSATSTVASLRVLTGRPSLVTNENIALPGLIALAGRTFTAAGLPKGLVLNSDGTVTGVTTAKPGVYKISVTIREGGVVTGTKVYYLEVLALSGNNIGGFEALLSTPDQPPAAKLAVTLSDNGSFTGTLVTGVEKTALAFKGAVVRSTAGVLTLPGSLTIARPGAPAGRVYLLTDFIVGANGKLSVKLKTRETANTEPVEIAAATSVIVGGVETGNPGVRLAVYSKTSAAPWSNVSYYTLALTAPTPLDTETQTNSLPAGSGYATGRMTVDGRLALTGKLGDGAPFTASLSTDASADYRLFARPYGAVPGAYVIAEINLSGVLTQNPSNANAPFSRYSVLFDLTNATVENRFDDGTYAFWQKPAGLASPANYTTGFGPLGLTVRVQPWLFFTPRDFGLLYNDGDTLGKITLALSGDTLSNAGENPRSLPTKFDVIFANATFANAIPSNAATFTGKLNTTTGFFSGTLTVTSGAKPLKVPYEGVFIVPPDAVVGTVTAEGFTLVPVTPGVPNSKPTAGRLQLKSLTN